MFTTAFEECIEGKGQKSEGRSNAVLQRTQALTIAWLHFVLHVHFFGLIIIKAYFIDIKENKTHASISSCNFYMRRNVHVFLFCMRFSLNSSRQILESINKLASWVSFAPNTVTLFFQIHYVTTAWLTQGYNVNVKRKAAWTKANVRWTKAGVGLYHFWKNLLILHPFKEKMPTTVERKWK